MASVASSRSASSRIDHRTVAAELEDPGLARGTFGDSPSSRDRAHETDRVHSRVSDYGIADYRSRPGEEVEDAGRQLGCGHHLGEQARAARPSSAPAPTRRCSRRRARERTPRLPSCRASSTGDTTPTTPSGTRVTNTLEAAEVEGGTEPSSRFASSPAIRKYSASSSTSP